MSNDDNETRLKEILRLIESDHKATIDFIARITTLRITVRSILFPLVSALAGLTLVNKNWIIAAVAIPLVVIGIGADAHIDFLLNIAHRRLVRLEYKIQAYLDYLVETGTVAAAAANNLDREIDSYQFGISRSLRGSTLQKKLAVTIKTATFWLYCILSVILIAVGVIALVSEPGGSSPGERDVCLVDQSGGQVHITELPDIKSGRATVVNCK